MENPCEVPGQITFYSINILLTIHNTVECTNLLKLTFHMLVHFADITSVILCELETLNAVLLFLFLDRQLQSKRNVFLPSNILSVFCLQEKNSFQDLRRVCVDCCLFSSHVEMSVIELWLASMTAHFSSRTLSYLNNAAWQKNLNPTFKCKNWKKKSTAA